MQKTSDVLWQDAQHQVLFEILDQIADPESGSAVVERLRTYTETHFALEEQYMEALDYPEREAHMRAHDRFRKEINALLSDGEEPDALFRDIVSTFLREWLTRHVFGIDKQLEAFLLANNVR